jgi:hypothetical protein
MSSAVREQQCSCSNGALYHYWSRAGLANRRRACSKWHAARFSSQPAFIAVPFFNFFFSSSVSILWRMYMCVCIYVYIYIGESNGKLPLRTCPECSVPEPYWLPDWALVSAKTSPRAEYQSINKSIYVHTYIYIYVAWTRNTYYVQKLFIPENNAVY